jgi:uncharacterized membrane protein YfcA
MTESNQIQWNLGGWLGGQLGGSVWMLVAGLLSFSEDPIAATTVIVFFALANLIGTMLWRRRERLSPYAAIELLLPVRGVSEKIQIGGTISARATYATIVLVVAALMLIFYFRFGRKSEKKDEAA